MPLVCSELLGAGEIGSRWRHGAGPPPIKRKPESGVEMPPRPRCRASTATSILADVLPHHVGGEFSCEHRDPIVRRPGRSDFVDKVWLHETNDLAELAARGLVDGTNLMSDSCIAINYPSSLPPPA